jgi:hypothetical protein
MNLRIGDVISYHKKEHVVIFVNDCRAMVIPLTFAVTWKDQPNGYTHFMAEGKGESISPNIEDEDLVRRMTITQMKNHFNGVAASSAGYNQTAEIESNSMKKTAQTAATIAATTSTQIAPAKTGKRGRKSAPAPAAPVVAAPAPGTPAPKPSQKGTLLGRGKRVLELGAQLDHTKEADVKKFIELIQAQWPVCGVNWCVKHLKRANLRLAERAARRKAAEEAAAQNEASKKAAAAKAAKDAEKAAADAAKAAKKAPKASPQSLPPAPAPANGNALAPAKRAGKSKSATALAA